MLIENWGNNAMQSGDLPIIQKTYVLIKNDIGVISNPDLLIPLVI